MLRNLLGITAAGELEQAEAALTAGAPARRPGAAPAARPLRLSAPQAFHPYVLGDVYAWAGQLRAVTIAKGSVFCLPQHLQSAADDVFGRLTAADPLRSLPATISITCATL